MIDVLLVSTDEEVKIVFETLEKRGVLRVRNAPSLSVAQYGIEFATPDCTFVHGSVSGMSVDVMVHDLKQILPEDANFAFLGDDPVEMAQAQKYGVRYLDLSQGPESLKASIQDVLREVAPTKSIVQIQDEEDFGEEREVIVAEPVAPELEEPRGRGGYADAVPLMQDAADTDVASQFDQVYDRVNLGGSRESFRNCPTVRELLEQEEASAHEVTRRPKRKRYSTWIPVASAVLLVPVIFYLVELISTQRSTVAKPATHPVVAQPQKTSAAASIPRSSVAMGSHPFLISGQDRMRGKKSEGAPRGGSPLAESGGATDIPRQVKEQMAQLTRWCMQLAPSGGSTHNKGAVN